MDLAADLALRGYFPLLFPDGRLPSPRWRLVAWLGGGSAVLLCFSYILMPESLDTFSASYNPFGIPGADVFWVLFVAGLAGLLASIVAAVVALVRRFRGATGVARQQMKWLAYAAVLVVLAAPTAPLAMPWSLLLIGALLSLPIAVGIAILRYRLYDIDLLINRALVYGLLTGTLGLFYIGGVVALQGLFQPLFSQGNDLAVVVSTLAIAALFLPLRRAIAGLHRPALLPPQVRHRAHAGRLQRHRARRDRPGSADGPPASRSWTRRCSPPR